MNNEHPDLDLPPPPERPDCCAGGCAVCVLEVYAEELQRWREACERLQSEARLSRKRHR